MKAIKVQNMQSVRGNLVPNQFVVTTSKGRYFQSYQTVIAFRPSKPGAKIQLDRDAWDYSRTTGKYRNIFLGETKKETERKIADKVYLLRDLNK